MSDSGLVRILSIRPNSRASFALINLSRSIFRSSKKRHYFTQVKEEWKEIELKIDIYQFLRAV